MSLRSASQEMLSVQDGPPLEPVLNQTNLLSFTKLFHYDRCSCYYRILHATAIFKFQFSF